MRFQGKTTFDSETTEYIFLIGVNNNCCWLGEKCNPSFFKLLYLGINETSLLNCTISSTWFESQTLRVFSISQETFDKLLGILTKISKTKANRVYNIERIIDSFEKI